MSLEVVFRWIPAAMRTLLSSLPLLLACSSSEPASPSLSSAPPDAGASPVDGAQDDASSIPDPDAADSDAGSLDASTCATRAADGGLDGATPPPALVTAMNAASPGDVVSLAGMNESAAPTLAVSVCPSADAPTLLFSDSPEMPSTDGILYADMVKPGRYRLYSYQANGGNQPRKFPIVVFNPGATNATVKIERRGLAAASKQYVSVGKTVILDWLTDEVLPDVVVAPGQRVLLDTQLDAITAQKDELVHSIYDVVTNAEVKITFVSIAANGDAVTATAGFSVLPADVDHQRGTFPNADVTIVAEPGAQASGVQRMRLGKDEIDATLEGVDRTSGAPQKLLGNYGLLYRIELGLPKAARAGLSPRGGGWGGVAHDGTASVALPNGAATLGSTTEAIVLGPIGPTTKLRLLSAGGSNLPVDLFLVTP